MIRSLSARAHVISPPVRVPIVSLSSTPSECYTDLGSPEVQRSIGPTPNTLGRMVAAGWRSLIRPRTGTRRWRLLDGLKNARLSRDIRALQMVVSHLREELQGTKKREQYARYLAFHDDLTALPNRRFFRERLERELVAPGEPRSMLAVIYLDLDGFKTLNDTYGHDTGDRLLILVATRLTHAVRSEDLVSRFGGDEYACLIVGACSRESLQQIAEALSDAVSHPFTVGEMALSVRPSIGIAVYPQDGLTAQALLMAADSAMYRAKRTKAIWAFSLAERTL